MLALLAAHGTHSNNATLIAIARGLIQTILQRGEEHATKLNQLRSEHQVELADFEWHLTGATKDDDDDDLTPPKGFEPNTDRDYPSFTTVVRGQEQCLRYVRPCPG
jgi:hypothetical protein